MTELCRHIKPEGTVCKGPAVRGTNFCRHHQLIKNTLDKVKPSIENNGVYKPLPFLFPEDRSAIQTNVFLVLNAFNRRRIDAKAAKVMLYGFQVCLSNLNKGPLAQTDADSSVQRVILTPEGDEIAPPRELLEKDESPVHYKDCPCRRCAEQFRGAAPEQHHADCQCGLCEPTTQECHPEAERSTAEEPVLSNAKEPAVSDLATNASQSHESKPLALSPLPFSLSPAVRTVSAQRLSSSNSLDPLQKQPNLRDYVHGDDIRKHEAQHAARARAAIEAGLEPPTYIPWHPSTHGDKWDREDREWREEIDRNRKEAIDSWNRENPDQPKEFKPYLTWGEEHDLKLAQMKKLREEEEARARGEAVSRA